MYILNQRINKSAKPKTITSFSEELRNFLKSTLRVPVARSGCKVAHCFCLVIGHIIASTNSSICETNFLTYYLVSCHDVNSDMKKFSKLKKAVFNIALFVLLSKNRWHPGWGSTPFRGPLIGALSNSVLGNNTNHCRLISPRHHVTSWSSKFSK